MQVISRASALSRGFLFFYTGKPCRNGHYSKRYTKKNICLECNRGAKDRFFSKKDCRARVMLKLAQKRANAKGLPFAITEENICIPSICPVLGIPLAITPYKAGRGRQGPTDSSPTLDRLYDALGYVPGNVRVISNRANRIKNNATIDELRAVLNDMEAFQ